MKKRDIAHQGQWVIAQDEDGLRVFVVIGGSRYGGSAVQVADLVDLKECIETAVERLTERTPHMAEAFDILRRFVQSGGSIPSEIVVPLEDDNEVLWNTAGLLEAVRNRVERAS